jgi:glycine cleavage system H lipoate-binding protein
MTETTATLPADLLYAADQDMWVRLEADGTARVGATLIAEAEGLAGAATAVAAAAQPDTRTWVF